MWPSVPFSLEVSPGRPPYRSGPSYRVPGLNGCLEQRLQWTEDVVEVGWLDHPGLDMEVGWQDLVVLPADGDGTAVTATSIEVFQKDEILGGWSSHPRLAEANGAEQENSRSRVLDEEVRRIDASPRPSICPVQEHALRGCDVSVQHHAGCGFDKESVLPYLSQRPEVGQFLQAECRRGGQGQAAIRLGQFGSQRWVADTGECLLKSPVS
jgi:hypothetical protein